MSARKKEGRSLRSQNLLIDTSSEEEESLEQKSSSLPQQRPVLASTTTPAGVSTINSSSTTSTTRGVPLPVQKKLFESLDNKGGIDIVSNSNRVLQSICDKDPDLSSVNTGRLES